MRVQFLNMSCRGTAHLAALTDYAASFFPHRPGKVYVTIKNARASSRGMCHGKTRCTVWLALATNDCKYPVTFDKMHYFRHANQENVKPITLNNWAEYALAIIAHELEHTTKGNQKMRRSRQEIHAWNREVEVVEASRTPEGVADIAKRFCEYVSIETHRFNREDKKKTPEYKLQHIIELQTKWQRKLKLAQTKIRKLKVRAKYFEKKAAANVAAQNVGGRKQAEI